MIRKKIIVLVLPLFLALTVVPLSRAKAVPIAVILEVIAAGVKKVIQAIDLKIQRLQNETIVLQNAQKLLENKLNRLKLAEIASWDELQRKQYEHLFQELWKVKSVISQIQRVRDIAKLQQQIVKEYHQAWTVISNSSFLSDSEKAVSEKVYLELLEESLDNLQHVTEVMTSFSVQMNDADRLKALHETEGRIRSNLLDLRIVNRKNFKLIHSRTDLFPNALKKMYGLEN
ncbi:conjugal transfer protein TraI [Algoriphagus pacificus]|uniref:Conjugal transfer protein TraI n=1 Tax=Algoriphagus pacificus TaxID=2811234 RepID=A0ABS3CK64_9BACT|nr:conjugal transfer protein TraI [Algoriphagus pacificus]MBN7817475.1 conjugal transfer protein TraI [Algoriphagus pacificus]